MHHKREILRACLNFHLDILKNVMDTNLTQSFRPKLHNIVSRVEVEHSNVDNVPKNVMDDVKALITWCWQEDEHERPSAGDVLTRINEISPSK